MSRITVAARVHLLPTSEGGRSAPLLSGYRSLLRFEGSEVDFGFEIALGPIGIPPGESATGRVSFWATDELPSLFVGQSFELREGARVVGRGTIVDPPVDTKERLDVDEIAQIQGRCDRASPGPWRSMLEGRDQTNGGSFIMTGPRAQRGTDIELSGATPDDQDFIAHARQDVPRLLSELELSTSTEKRMTPEEIAEIQARCDRASPGPWKSMIEGRDHTSGSSFVMTGPPNERGEDIELSGATADDQDFIAHARQDVPRLLEEVMRLRSLLGEK